MRRRPWRRRWWAWAAQAAHAVPAFAAQTGQPCASCHVGGFGPQLTAYGRSFKLHGYTDRSGVANLPIAAMFVASFDHTSKDQPSPPAQHYGTNDNTGVDQVSLFVAGGLGSHLGGFIQTTYDGIGRTWSWDNVDLRATTHTQLGGQDVLLGLSLNNSPGVQDVWNTLPAWGYPYTDSALLPGPAAAPLIGGGLAQNSLGLTAYAWINSSLYIEGGAYRSVGEKTLARLGADPFSPGDIQGAAPYGRIAYEHPALGGSLEVGAFALRADIHPGRDRTTGNTDNYTDLGLDAAYNRTLDSGDVVTVNGRYVHERQSMNATCDLAMAAPGCAKASLNDVRADASYYWKNKVGVTVSAFDTTGPANDTLYAGNRTFRPDSNGMMLQVDTTLWGDGSSPFGPRFNMRVGAQFTAYGQFDGASKNYDGLGANASDNNSVRIFTWLAY